MPSSSSSLGRSVPASVSASSRQEPRRSVGAAPRSLVAAVATWRGPSSKACPAKDSGWRRVRALLPGRRAGAHPSTGRGEPGTRSRCVAPDHLRTGVRSLSSTLACRPTSAGSGTKRPRPASRRGAHARGGAGAPSRAALAGAERRDATHPGLFAGAPWPVLRVGSPGRGRRSPPEPATAPGTARCDQPQAGTKHRGRQAQARQPAQTVRRVRRPCRPPRATHTPVRQPRSRPAGTQPGPRWAAPESCRHSTSTWRG